MPVQLGPSLNERVMGALFGQPKAQTRIGRTPIMQQGPFIPGNMGEFDPITQSIRVQDMNDSQTILHEDVHSMVKGSGILDKLSANDFEAFKAFSTNESLSGADLIDEILAEGLARGEMGNKQALIRRVESKATTPPEKSLVERLKRIARSSEALKTFTSLRNQITKEANETGR